MVGPFLDLTLVAEEELRRTTIPLFYDLLECEFANKGTFKQVGRPSDPIVSPPMVKSLKKHELPITILVLQIK